MALKTPMEEKAFMRTNWRGCNLEDRRKTYTEKGMDAILSGHRAGWVK